MSERVGDPRVGDPRLGDPRRAGRVVVVGVVKYLYSPNERYYIQTLSKNI